MSDTRDRRLFANGLFLIVTALVVGAFMQRLPNPRMGLATHLEALMLGMLLLLLGLLWGRFSLPDGARALLGWLPILGAYCSVGVHLFAALYPAGEYWMPFAAAGAQGSPLQERILSIGMVVIGLTMLPAMVIALWGMLRAEERSSGAELRSEEPRVTGPR
jgi:hydroxylaminobenzene mutase